MNVTVLVLSVLGFFAGYGITAFIYDWLSE